MTLERKKFVLYYPPVFIGGERSTIVSETWFFDDVTYTPWHGFRRSELNDIMRMEIDDVLHVSSLKIWRVG